MPIKVPVHDVFKAFVDESIHQKEGFIVTAIVITNECVDEDIRQALLSASLVPGKDEYKSRGSKAGNLADIQLRTDLSAITHTRNCKIALVVSAVEERSIIGAQVISLMLAMAERGRFGSLPIEIFFDEGIRLDTKSIGTAERTMSLNTNCDSKIILGLQLADLVAHVSATILKCDLGIINKQSPASEGSGYDSDTMIELEYELWAGFRYQLASNELSYPQLSREPTFHAFHDSYGLFISDKCNAEIIRTALDRFAAIYLGCIH